MDIYMYIIGDSDPECHSRRRADTAEYPAGKRGARILEEAAEE